jgi:hypothetical protein
MALVERVTALTRADFAELIEHAERRETIIPADHLGCG